MCEARSKFANWLQNVYVRGLACVPCTYILIYRCAHRMLRGESNRGIVSFCFVRVCVRACVLVAKWNSIAKSARPPFPFAFLPRVVFPFPLPSPPKPTIQLQLGLSVDIHQHLFWIEPSHYAIKPCAGHIRVRFQVHADVESPRRGVQQRSGPGDR